MVNRRGDHLIIAAIAIQKLLRPRSGQRENRAVGRPPLSAPRNDVSIAWGTGYAVALWDNLGGGGLAPPRVRRPALLIEPF